MPDIGELISEVMEDVQVRIMKDARYFGILLGSPLAVAKAPATLPGVHTKHET